MKKDETRKNNCEFTVHPCNFKIKIKEVKPFYVRACKSIVLDLKVINDCNCNSVIKIKSNPKYGKLYLLNSNTLIYKSTKKVSALDLFQILFEDEYGESCVESVLIRIVSK